MLLKNENISEVYPSIFRIKVNLPNNPLKFINAYLVKGDERSLLIDTAMNMESCYIELSSALDEIGVDREKLDLFITHIHADHIGLIDRFIKKSKVYMSDTEHNVVVEAIKHPDYWHSMNNFLVINGMPKSILDGALKYLDQVYLQTYPSMENDLLKNFKSIKDNEEIKYGDFEFQGILTPGHSPGHMCLYDKKNKIIFLGDHVLFGITPNITWWPNMPNSLRYYIESLNRVYDLDINFAFPGHGEPGKSIKKRIEAIKKHHQERFKEIMDALESSPKTAYQVASEIKWNIRYDAWESFPKTQKYFALGETISHLLYLEEIKKIKSEFKDGKIIFKLNEF